MAVQLSGIDVKEVDLKTINKSVGSTPTDLGAGAVSAGMKRFITFVKYQNRYAGANAIFLCSGASALNAASALAKDRQDFARKYDTLGYPEPPSTLFTIAENKYLTAFSTKGSVQLFAQYYDE